MPAFAPARNCHTRTVRVRVQVLYYASDSASWARKYLYVFKHVAADRHPDVFLAAKAATIPSCIRSKYRTPEYFWNPFNPLIFAILVDIWANCPKTGKPLRLPVYSSSVLFYRKKNPDGTFSGLRLCTDNRQINKYTKRMSFPLPNTESILDAVGRYHVFSSFDLAHGFYQIRVIDNSDPNNPEPSEHIQRTAICTQYGLYEWVVCPFGMSNIPSHFQRFLNHVLEPHKRPWLSIYLDDILLHTKDIESHKEKMDELLSLLEDNVRGHGRI